MKKITLLIFSFIMVLISCNRYEKQVYKVVLFNELQECEEGNLHYRISKVLEGNDYKKIENEIVLPILDKNINTKKNNEILFPEITKKRIAVTAEGYYSCKPHNQISDGCNGAHFFKIIKIENVVNITNIETFPIDYKE